MKIFVRGSLSLAALTLLVVSATRGDDWPQWMGPQRDDVWRETGILDKFPKDGPPIKWRVPVSGGYSGPVVAGGRVFVTDYVVEKGKITNNPPSRDKLEGKERVLCFGAADGKPLWKYEYDCPYNLSYPSGPRAAPAVAGGKVYTLGAEGNLLCLDADKGAVVWSKDLKKEYNAKTPQWGFACNPLVDGNKLYCIVGGEGSVAVAFDKDTGKELWRALSAKEPGYSSPVIIEAGGKRQLLIWDAEALHGLDPETGKVYWSFDLKVASGMSIMVPQKYKDFLFAGGAFGKAALLKLDADKPAVTEVWLGKGSTAVYPVNSTPLIVDGTLYGVDQPGPLRAVKLETGERLWETFAPTTNLPRDKSGSGTAFLVKNGDRFFLFSETGDLIIARLSPKGYEEVSRCHLLAPTNPVFGREVVWSHPAFADRCVFARNDKELVCASLAAK
jgi:outer membrane protein assembly factor BamB